jgi:hypothetical protein
MSSNNLDVLRDKASQSSDVFSRALSQGSTASGGAAVVSGGQWNAWLLLSLTILVIGFSVLVLHYMRSMLKDGHNASDVLRLATMPMVIAAAIFLLLLGFSNDQITPVIGLLGTMIGYILGSATTRQQNAPTSPSDSQPPAK